MEPTYWWEEYFYLSRNLAHETKRFSFILRDGHRHLCNVDSILEADEMAKYWLNRLFEDHILK